MVHHNKIALLSKAIIKEAMHDNSEILFPYGENMEFQQAFQMKLMHEGYDAFTKTDTGIIYKNSSEDIYLIVSYKNISPSKIVYQKFCQLNPELSSNMSKIYDSYIYDTHTETKKGFEYYTEDSYHDFHDEELVQDIIKTYETKQASNKDEVNQFVKLINLAGLPKDKFSLSPSNFKIRDVDGSLILVDCFDNISKTKNTMSNYKNILKNDVPEDLQSYLDNNNFHKLGSGLFSDVYSDPSHKVVIKINKGFVDESYIKFANFCRSENSPHLPKLGKVREFGKGSDKFYVIAMEKLDPLPSNEDTKNLLKFFTLSTLKYKTVPDRDVGVYNSQKDALWNLIQDMKVKLTGGDISFDLHQGNVMLRGNTVVLIDPISDFDEIMQASSKL